MNNAVVASTWQSNARRAHLAFSKFELGASEYSLNLSFEQAMVPPLTRPRSKVCTLTSQLGSGSVFFSGYNATTTFTNFNKSWAQFKAGFGDVTVNTSLGWLGNDRIHALTGSGVELMVANNVQNHFYKNFLVESETRKYGMTVSSTSNSKDNNSFANYHSMSFFSTYDQDNDSMGGSNCASSYATGWWHNQCYQESIAGNNAGTVYWQNAAGSAEYVTWIEMWVR